MNQVGDLEDSILRTRRFKEQRARQNQKRRENRMRQLEQPSVYSSSTPEDFDGRSFSPSTLSLFLSLSLYDSLNFLY